MREINNREDVMDVRDVIERFEELESDKEDAGSDFSEEAAEELTALSEWLSELEGTGGDHQWRGVWYPVTLIRDSYFQDYAKELAEDLGMIPENATWPAYCIDWEMAARDLKMDYTSTEFDGVTYWGR